MTRYRLLLTRPRAQSEALAELLRPLGVESLIEPLLEIHFFASTGLDLTGVQALLVTSGNGIEALAAACSRRDIPLYVVGAGSAAAARAAGFTKIMSAGGDSDALAMLVQTQLDPAAGALLHIAGATIAGDLDRQLTNAGFVFFRKTLYEARPVVALSPACREALKIGGLDGVAFFSPRSGATFVRLAAAEGLAAACVRLQAFCLSAAVREQVVGLPWCAVEVAAAPSQAALLELLQREVRCK